MMALHMTLIAWGIL